VVVSVDPLFGHHRTAPVEASPVVQETVNDVSRTFVIDRFATGVLVILAGVEVLVAVAVFVAVGVVVEARVELDVAVAWGVDVAVAVGEADGTFIVVAVGVETAGAHAHDIWARLISPGMLRSPAPYALGYCDAPAVTMTDDRREVRTCSRVRLGKVDQISAAAPATWGEAIDVPLS
jgi:hypothetical protein